MNGGFQLSTSAASKNILEQKPSRIKNTRTKYLKIVEDFYFTTHTNNIDVFTVKEHNTVLFFIVTPSIAFFLLVEIENLRIFFLRACLCFCLSKRLI